MDDSRSSDISLAHHNTGPSTPGDWVFEVAGLSVYRSQHVWTDILLTHLPAESRLKIDNHNHGRRVSGRAGSIMISASDGDRTNDTRKTTVVGGVHGKRASDGFVGKRGSTRKRTETVWEYIVELVTYPMRWNNKIDKTGLKVTVLGSGEGSIIPRDSTTSVEDNANPLHLWGESIIDPGGLNIRHIKTHTDPQVNSTVLNILPSELKRILPQFIANLNPDEKLEIAGLWMRDGARGEKIGVSLITNFVFWYKLARSDALSYALSGLVVLQMALAFCAQPLCARTVVSSLPLSNTTLTIIDILFIPLHLLVLNLDRATSIPSQRSRIRQLASWTRLRAFALLLIFVDCVIYLARSRSGQYGGGRLSRALFPLLAITRNDTLKTILQGLFKSFKQSRIVYLMLAGILAMWTLFAYYLLQRVDSANNRFDNPLVSFLTILRSFTSAPSALYVAAPIAQNYSQYSQYLFLGLSLSTDLLAINLIVAVGNAALAKFSEKALRRKATFRSVALLATWLLISNKLDDYDNEKTEEENNEGEDKSSFGYLSVDSYLSFCQALPRNIRPDDNTASLLLLYILQQRDIAMIDTGKEGHSLTALEKIFHQADKQYRDSSRSTQARLTASRMNHNQSLLSNDITIDLPSDLCITFLEFIRLSSLLTLGTQAQISCTYLPVLKKNVNTGIQRENFEMDGQIDHQNGRESHVTRESEKNTENLTVRPIDSNGDSRMSNQENIKTPTHIASDKDHHITDQPVYSIIIPASRLSTTSFPSSQSAILIEKKVLFNLPSNLPTPENFSLKSITSACQYLATYESFTMRNIVNYLSRHIHMSVGSFNASYLSLYFQGRKGGVYVLGIIGLVMRCVNVVITTYLTALVTPHTLPSWYAGASVLIAYMWFELAIFLGALGRSSIFKDPVQAINLCANIATTAALISIRNSINEGSSQLFISDTLKTALSVYGFSEGARMLSTTAFGIHPYLPDTLGYHAEGLKSDQMGLDSKISRQDRLGIAKAYLRVVLLLGAVVYAASIATQQAYCGLLTDASVANETSPDDDSYAWLDFADLLNFNDYWQAFFTMEQVALLGSWSVVMDAAEKVVSVSPYFLFFGYRLGVTLVALPLLLSFVIRSYSLALDRQEEARASSSSSNRREAKALVPGVVGDGDAVVRNAWALDGGKQGVRVAKEEGALVTRLEEVGADIENLESSLRYYRRMKEELEKMSS